MATQLRNRQLTINLAEGQMLNGRLSVTVASNNLTVALKTLAGNNATASDPIYVMINGALRTITAALSVTKNAATNWCNAGSAELAANEIDYFVYLGYNTTDGVVIGFSRIPCAGQYSDFSATTTDEKYCAISTITNAASTDYYEVVGRFAATLSAGAGYTWTVPTYTAINLIQRPIFETRKLSYLPVVTGFAATPTIENAYYILSCSQVFISRIRISGTSNATTFTITAPMIAVESFRGPARLTDNGAVVSTGAYVISIGGRIITLTKDWAGAAFTSSGSKAMLDSSLIYNM